MFVISFSTLFGIIIGIGLFIYAIMSSTDNYIMFISATSFLLVIGGTLAATMIAYQGKYVVKTLVSLLSIIGPFNLNGKTLFKDVGRIIEFSSIAKKKGPLGIKQALTKKEQKDHLIQFGVNLLTSGYNGTDIRTMLEDSVESTFERNMVQSNILNSMAAFCPAFGMIGTLVGLVIMFEKMGSDISAIGQGMALALITTLYGVLLTQLLFKPASEKVRQREEIYRFRNLLIMEGLSMIADGKDSLTIQDRLNSFMDPNGHFNIAQPSP
ncbi:MAG: motility protein A [Candidatus Marinamargulisbacteria bacterium]